MPHLAPLKWFLILILSLTLLYIQMVHYTFKTPSTFPKMKHSNINHPNLNWK